nr:MAG TPA: hypothetical protein [Caudoviricetes sp.]
MIDYSVSCIRRETPCRMASTGCVGGCFTPFFSVNGGSTPPLAAIFFIV